MTAACPCCNGGRVILEPTLTPDGTPDPSEVVPVRCRWCNGTGTKQGFHNTNQDERQAA